MTREIIAVVRLAYGEVGYYDELSRIYLTVSNPQKEILAGTNCVQLRRSVKSGRLRLISGSLGEEKKADFSKKGNKFTGVPQTDTPIQSVVVTETPASDINASETKVTETLVVVESGVIEIATDKTVEEAPSADKGGAGIAEVVAADESAKKISRKKPTNKQEVD